MTEERHMNGSVATGRLFQAEDHTCVNLDGTVLDLKNVVSCGLDNALGVIEALRHNLREASPEENALLGVESRLEQARAAFLELEARSWPESEEKPS